MRSRNFEGKEARQGKQSTIEAITAPPQTDDTKPIILAPLINHLTPQNYQLNKQHHGSRTSEAQESLVARKGVDAQPEEKAAQPGRQQHHRQELVGYLHFFNPNSLTHTPSLSCWAGLSNRRGNLNRDKKETLSQNYDRFGLVAKLSHTAGGKEKKIKDILLHADADSDSPFSTITTTKTKTTTTTTTTKKDPLTYHSRDRGLLQLTEVKVERDPATGRILRVIRDSNPLRDPLNEIESSSSSAASDKDEEEEEEEGEEWGGIDSDSPEEAARKERKRPLVVRELERLANQPVEKPERHQSEREREWLERLVARHGDDTSAMARDAKLNPMQQTAADLKKRLRKAGLLS